ncbi:MAG: adenylosuccinate synthase, partial [Cellvibrionales bacterium TMED122]
EISICVGYSNDSGETVSNPIDAVDYENLRPVYETLPGWSDSAAGLKSLDALPETARAYIARIEELVGAPIDIISTGPDREETILLRHPFGG